VIRIESDFYVRRVDFDSDGFKALYDRIVGSLLGKICDNESFRQLPGGVEGVRFPTFMGKIGRFRCTFGSEISDPGPKCGAERSEPK
jgi:hypothetical protein